MNGPDFNSADYRAAYRRINGLVVVGEALAARHFRSLARLLPEDRSELLRLAAMEARHAADFSRCAKELGLRGDTALARRLLAPLRQQFQRAEASGDRMACLVIQCLIIESVAVAAYRGYLPVADAGSRGVTAAVLQDETEHLSYGERWLRARFEVVADPVLACCREALPPALALLQLHRTDLLVIGMDPIALVADIQLALEGALSAIGFGTGALRRLQASLF
jgi:fatty aldehyde decarbonylase